MTPTRCVTWIAMMAFAAGLWWSLHQARQAANDPLNLTRLLFRQARKVGPEDERAEARFYIRYRFPEGDPDRQSWLFERLWRELRACAREEVRVLDQLPVRTEDGKERPGRKVHVLGKDRDGDTVDLVLTWVRYRNTWYIHECSSGGSARRFDGL